jgi:hypothetical protein
MARMITNIEYDQVLTFINSFLSDFVMLTAYSTGFVKKIN